MKRLWAIAIQLLAPLVASAADIALPPQPLGTSLQELAKQSGIQIIFFSKLVQEHDAPALNGTFTPEAALDKLLAGTNLTYHALNDRTIEVAPRPPIAALPWTPLSQPKPEEEAPGAPLAEVQITAERSDLSQMHADIVRLENEFYARYNQANTDHRYDVVFCRSLQITGSHVERRSCEPASFAATSARMGWGWYQLPILEDGPAASLETPTDPEELRAYQRNMVEIVRRHPELLELIKQRNDLVERYRAAQKRKAEQVRPAHRPGRRPYFPPVG